MTISFSAWEAFWVCLFNHHVDSVTYILSFYSNFFLLKFSSVHSLSCVFATQLFVTMWPAAHQASLSITSSRNLLKLAFMQSVMPSKHLILCFSFPYCFQSFPASGSFSSESVLHTRWPKYWSFSFSDCPSSEYSGVISFRKLNSWATIQRSNSCFLRVKKNLYWICYSIASLLCFGFLAARHVGS